MKNFVLTTTTGLFGAEIVPVLETISDPDMGKANGATDLIIAGEPKTFPGPPVNVTVKFNKTYHTVNVYDPVEDKSTTRSPFNVSSATVSVTDHPIVVELGPN